MYNETETALGIQNFRREWMGNVYSLSNLPNIDNISEKMSDPATFNKRFSQLGQAIRHCFNATGDIAIRDKRYLETFFSNYVNPIITKSYKHPITSQHLATKNWDYNGVPVTFAEPRVEYNVDAIGKLEFTACYTWVFVNGVLMDEDAFTIMNTAYGVKCYIKASFVPDNAEVNIAVNRIFNQSTKYVTYTVPKDSDTSQDAILIPVSNLGTFYHHKYVQVYVYRNWSEISNSTDFYYKLLPRDTYQTSINVTGDTVKIDIQNFKLKQGEKLFIFNSVYYWNYNNVSKDGSGWTNEIDLTIKDSGNITRPIPFCSVEDFDVFFNGYRLTPGIHWTLLRGGNELAPYRIKLLLNQKDTTKPFSVRIWHNESVVDDDDVILIRDANLQRQGLITSKSVDAVPLMPSIGHYWLNDRGINNKYLRKRHRQVMSLKVENTDVINSLSNSEFCTRIVQTPALESVLNFVVDNYSEFDIVAEWIGLDTITSSLYADLPDVVTDSTSVGVIDVFNGRGWEFYDTVTAAVEQFRLILRYYQDNHVSSAIVLDANYSPDETTYPMNLLGKLLVLDSNMAQSEVLVLDTNAFFVK